MAFHVYRDKLGYWRWFLCTANGRRLADSGEFYTSREECAAAVNLVQNLQGATIQWPALP